ncbi:hypothetical protein [Aliiroseovarius lamellibrachiae]|uniref:hypothetical protein n=1 Tax=Aliiroseovarius lamellibrachiae TaxID=1924933 RepID=UPI001BDFFED6|nr:hypothetical protein [Aliiroseovarius lamellibrachiae]MBT2130242.1 hypothetical protein [Aliiroseovarius lamellibrachiae]
MAQVTLRVELPLETLVKLKHTADALGVSVNRFIQNQLEAQVCDDLPPYKSNDLTKAAS